MTNTINTHNQLQNNAVKAETKAESSREEETASQTGKKAEASTIVNLTSSNVLQQLGDRIEQLPEINSAKVDSIKQALTNGEYKPDAEVIARKFSEIEKLLP
jgi:negative regulator of flagellin synthesis FlgM